LVRLSTKEQGYPRKSWRKNEVFGATLDETLTATLVGVGTPHETLVFGANFGKALAVALVGVESPQETQLSSNPTQWRIWAIRTCRSTSSAVGRSCYILE
jgi:hypothetical protein